MPDHLTYLQFELEALSAKYSGNFGLYNGKAGICICHFLLSEIESEKKFHLEKAQVMLDELSNDIARIESLEYGNGLAGVGWAIEWLAQNKYIDINSDYILEDLDDEIYKSVVYAKSPGLSLENGTLGKLMYFYKRSMAKNPDPIRYRVLCNHECMVLLTDEMMERLTIDESGRSNGYARESDQDLAGSLMLLLKLHSLKINTEAVSQMICGIAGYFEKQASRFAGKKKPNPVDSELYLLYAWRKAGIQLKDQQWTTHALSHYNNLRNETPKIKSTGPFHENIERKWSNITQEEHFGNNKAQTQSINSIRDWILTYSTLFHNSNHPFEEAFLLQ